MSRSSAAFYPPRLLRNRHIQSLLASSKLRQKKLRRTAKEMLSVAREELLPAGEHVRLHSIISEHPCSTGASLRPLVVLIHGWEGSSESSYILSSAGHLYQQGFDVLRLHLRDHGPSHGLNRELFHAARIEEVMLAFQTINQRYRRPKAYLLGFSLGGNFALRIAASASLYNLRLDKVIAVSPVIDPANTMSTLEKEFALYRVYFMRKWKRSLALKQAAHPDILTLSEIDKIDGLSDLTELLVQKHTPFRNVQEYYDSYTLTGTTLSTIDIPTTIVTSKDDPVIPSEDFNRIEANPSLSIQMQEHGGHCGFIKDYRLNSWINEVLQQEFSKATPNITTPQP